MKKAFTILTFSLIIGAAFLYRWYMHGSWRENGHTLIERDAVRFGSLPLLLTLLWIFAAIITVIPALKLTTPKSTK